MKQRVRNIIGALVASAGCIASSVAFATPIQTNGQWYMFTYDGSGTEATACSDFCSMIEIHLSVANAPSPPWSFSGPAIFSITDGFGVGDVSTGNVFDVFDNSVLLGSTSAPGIGRSNCIARGQWNDPECNFAEGLFSHGSFVLGDGAHNITIHADALPAYPGDLAFFNAISVPASVPEPASLALFGLGFGIAGLAKRSRRKNGDDATLLAG